MARLAIAEVKAARDSIRADFDGSEALFASCWRQYLGYLRGATDNPADLGEVADWVDSIAAEKVNNPRSRFYMRG